MGADSCQAVSRSFLGAAIAEIANASPCWFSQMMQGITAFKVHWQILDIRYQFDDAVCGAHGTLSGERE